MSLFVEHYQYSWGDKNHPDHFGYYVGCWDQSAEEAPFPSRTARSAYEEAVEAYVHEQSIAGDPYIVAACMTIIRDGQEEDREFARAVLEREGIAIDGDQEEELEEIVIEYGDYKEQMA